jgi:hypothetical protein
MAKSHGKVWRRWAARRGLSPVAGASLLVLLSACSHGVPVILAPEPRMTLQPLPDSAQVYYDNGLAFADSARLVVRDSAAWRAIWQRATRPQASPPPMPDIDFNREMVVVAAAGRMKPGDVIHVDSIGVYRSTTVLTVRTVTACQPFPYDAYPFEIIRIPRRDGPVQFIERRTRAASCP